MIQSNPTPITLESLSTNLTHHHQKLYIFSLSLALYSQCKLRKLSGFAIILPGDYLITALLFDELQQFLQNRYNTKATMAWGYMIDNAQCYIWNESSTAVQHASFKMLGKGGFSLGML